MESWRNEKWKTAKEVEWQQEAGNDASAKFKGKSFYLMGPRHPADVYLLSGPGISVSDARLKAKNIDDALNQAESVIKKTAAIQNKFFRIKSDLKLEVFTGEVEETNSWYGASRLLKRKRKTITAKKGDEIHDLVGGRFLIQGSKVYEMPTTEESHPFERSQPRPLPLKSIEEITEKESKDVQYRPKGK